MGVHSGKFGVVHKIVDSNRSAVEYIRNWSLEDTQAPESYYASNTRGGQFANQGVFDNTGSFSGFGGDPLLFPGDLFEFEGYTAPDTDVYNTAGDIYKLSAIVESLTITWGWGASQTLGWSIDFAAASSGLSIESGAAILDDAVTVPEKMCGLVVEYTDDTDAPAAYAPWGNVITATLTFTAANQPYVNSSTGCNTYRKPGNLGWTLSLVEQRQDQLQAKGTQHRWKIYTDFAGDEAWILEYGMITGYTGLTVDRETGGIIQKTVNVTMQGSNGTTLGQITRPSGAAVWPSTNG